MQRFLLASILLLAALGCSSELGYQVGWTSVVYAKRGVNGIRQVTTLKEADPKSFEILSDRYGKDRNHVYYQGQILKDCDPATLELLGKRDLYCRDAERVYISARTLSTDAPNFALVGAGYSKDSGAVYFLDKTVEGADPASWESFQKGPYGRDAESVYHEGSRLPEADPASFEALNYHYGKDGHSVWFDELEVEGADPATFEASSEKMAEGRDKNFTYDRGKKTRPASGGE